MKNKRSHPIIITVCIAVLIGSIALLVSGCETVRGAGKDVKNVISKTGNTVDNIFGNQKKY